MEDDELQKLRSVELARIKKWQDNLKKVKREATRQQAGLGKKSAEEIKRGIIKRGGIIGGQINVVRGNGNGNGAKGNKVAKETKRGSQASTGDMMRN